MIIIVYFHQFDFLVAIVGHVHFLAAEDREELAVNLDGFEASVSLD